jgi:hypothetical protein
VKDVLVFWMSHYAWCVWLGEFKREVLEAHGTSNEAHDGADVLSTSDIDVPWKENGEIVADGCGTAWSCQYGESVVAC